CVLNFPAGTTKVSIHAKMTTPKIMTYVWGVDNLVKSRFGFPEEFVFFKFISSFLFSVILMNKKWIIK
ncbi:hypothetical protein EFM1CSP_19950, partial [Enterococcus faecium]